MNQKLYVDRHVQVGHEETEQEARKCRQKLQSDAISDTHRVKLMETSSKLRNMLADDQDWICLVERLIFLALNKRSAVISRLVQNRLKGLTIRSVEIENLERRSIRCEWHRVGYPNSICSYEKLGCRSSASNPAKTKSSRLTMSERYLKGEKRIDSLDDESISPWLDAEHVYRRRDVEEAYRNKTIVTSHCGLWRLARVLYGIGAEPDTLQQSWLSSFHQWNCKSSLCIWTIS